MQVRWRTCPFELLAAAIPTAGRILEVGCGHGLFSAYLAVASHDRDVIGVDIDRAKIVIAERVAEGVARKGGHLRVGAVDAGSLPPGEWDAIVVVDVLYLLPTAAQEALVTQLCSRLRPGGALVVKEMATTPAWKLALARAQEFVSVRVLRITEGDDLVFLPPSTVSGWMRAAGLVPEEQRLDRGRPHPHHLVLGRRATVAS